MFHTTQCAWSSVVLLRATSMSRMLRKKDCVPAGTLVQLIAGDSPSPVATPGAAWLNFNGMSAAAGNPATVKVSAGAAGAAARCPAGGCAAAGIAASRAIVDTHNPIVFRMLFSQYPARTSTPFRLPPPGLDRAPARRFRGPFADARLPRQRHRFAERFLRNRHQPHGRRAGPAPGTAGRREGVRMRPHHL